MESKTDWAPWEFYKVCTHPFLGKGEGLHLFSFPDPYLERILFYRKASHFSTNRTFRLISGQDLTVEWIQENWDTVDLFASDDVFFVLLSELISNEVQQFLIAKKEYLKTVILSFTEEMDWFNPLSKNASSVSIVRPVKFWEGHQLLELILLFFDIELNYEAEQFIIESLPLETGSLMSQLNLIKVHFPEQGRILTKNDILPLVSRQKLDFFALASLLGKKQLNQFYSKLVNFDGNPEEFFRFIEGHILKLYDHNYLKQKNRPSRYDKEIIEHGKLWKKDDLLQQMLIFGDYCIKAKSAHSASASNINAEHILETIRLRYLNSL